MLLELLAAALGTLVGSLTDPTFWFAGGILYKLGTTRPLWLKYLLLNSVIAFLIRSYVFSLIGLGRGASSVLGEVGHFLTCVAIIAAVSLFFFYVSRLVDREHSSDTEQS
jgi:hypothetical protein